MRLPTPADRARLRLADPAQRFIWAILQLSAGLYRSNPDAAIAAKNIKATTASRGLTMPSLFTPSKPLEQIPRHDKLAEKLGINSSFRWNKRAFDLGFFSLPIDYQLMAQGLDFGLCVSEISSDTIVPLSEIPPGDPIPDNSTCVTVEQFLIEQARLCLADSKTTTLAQASNFTEAESLLAYFESEHKETMSVENLELDGGDRVTQMPIISFSLPPIPAIPTSLTGLSTDNTFGIKPHNYCTLSRYFSTKATF